MKCIWRYVLLTLILSALAVSFAGESLAGDVPTFHGDNLRAGDQTEQFDLREKLTILLIQNMRYWKKSLLRARNATRSILFGPAQQLEKALKIWASRWD